MSLGLFPDPPFFVQAAGEEMVSVCGQDYLKIHSGCRSFQVTEPLKNDKLAMGNPDFFTSSQWKRADY